jgi:hypothetical protein
MGKSEQELQTLLNITARFASKWNLKFNSKKSKVMVIGKNIYKLKRWDLGNDQIEETNVYKYLGVYFSRSLKFTYHIETYIKENVQKKLNYMTQILGEHGNFNRISFGDSLWTSIIRPSITHGCAVWFSSAISSAQNIESLQYQAGKIILKTKMSFPKYALLSEFGWKPINEFLDRQRVNYFARFDELPTHRLCKIIFMELKNSECVEWKYVNYMKNIFQLIGLDHYYYENFNTNIFKHFFGKAVQDKELSRRLEMSSLSIYNTFNISPGKQSYLCSINYLWASRLNFLARTNYLPLNERLFKINLCESSKCNICDDDIVEDLHHFLFKCKTLRGIRQVLFEEIETVIKSFYPDLAFSKLPPFQKLQFLIGEFGLSCNTERGFSLYQFSKKNIM